MFELVFCFWQEKNTFNNMSYIFLRYNELNKTWHNFSNLPEDEFMFGL